MSKKKTLIDKIIDDQTFLNSIGTISEKWQFIYHKGNKTEYLVSDNGNLQNIKTGVLRIPTLNKYGYLKFNLYENNVCYTKSIHRLVAEAFVDNPDPDTKTKVNHIDGNKTNNHYTNLENG